MDETFVPEKHATLRNLLIGIGVFVLALTIGGFIFLYTKHSPKDSFQETIAATSSQDQNSSYRILGKTYSKDDKNVFVNIHYNGESTITVLVGADPATFREVVDGIGQDKNGFWALDYKLPFLIDPDTFALVGEYAKDKNHVYFINLLTAEILPNLDPATFEDVGMNYTKDKTNVWYGNPFGGMTKVDNADPTTFELISSQLVHDPDAQDKNHKYLRGEIVQ